MQPLGLGFVLYYLLCTFYTIKIVDSQEHLKYLPIFTTEPSLPPLPNHVCPAPQNSYLRMMVSTNLLSSWSWVPLTGHQNFGCCWCWCCSAPRCCSSWPIPIPMYCPAPTVRVCRLACVQRKLSLWYFIYLFIVWTILVCTRDKPSKRFFQECFKYDIV